MRQKNLEITDNTWIIMKLIRMSENLREGSRENGQSPDWLSVMLAGTTLRASNAAKCSPIVRSKQSIPYDIEGQWITIVRVRWTSEVYREFSLENSDIPYERLVEKRRESCTSCMNSLKCTIWAMCKLLSTCELYLNKSVWNEYILWVDSYL